MPKAAIIQNSFTTGEVSPLFYGSVDNPRYKKGTAVSLNYLPVLQGPSVRRPGTRYVGPPKNPSNPPVIIPLRISQAVNYMVEMGAGYVRFWTEKGMAVVPSTGSYLVGSGSLNFAPSSATNTPVFGFYFYGATLSTNGFPNAINFTTTAMTAGNPMEIGSPYSEADLSLIRYSLKDGKLYLYHPNYPIYVLAANPLDAGWSLSAVNLQDGPYKAANTFDTVGDFATIQLTSLDVGGIALPTAIQVSGSTAVSGAVAGTAGAIRLTVAANTLGLKEGNFVFVEGVAGTVEANNYSTFPSFANSSTIAVWPLHIISSTVIELVGSTFVNAYVSGGNVYPALFAQSAIATATGAGTAYDLGRAIAIESGGDRYWGNISAILDAVTVMALAGSNIAFPAVTSVEWYLGSYYGLGRKGYPGCGTFYQDRHWIAGCPVLPSQVDGSQTSDYTTFSPSVAQGDTALQVEDNNAVSFQLISRSSDSIRWLAAAAQGLLAVTGASEFLIAPTSSGAGITPTNVNVTEATYYGGANVAPIQIGVSTLYVQNATRKIRSMHYVFYVGTFLSEDVTVVSEHIFQVGIAKIVVQKEPQPNLWAILNDGSLVSAIFEQTDQSITVGWVRHQLGGISDFNSSPAKVLDIGVMPDASGLFDRVWLLVQRIVRGSTVLMIEYLELPFQKITAQEDAFQGDAGATYFNPITITGISNANPGVVTATAHGFSTGDDVRIYDTIGTVYLNDNVYKVTVIDTNNFSLSTVEGVAVDTSALAPYVSGGTVAKLVSTVTGITWLDGETIGLLLDGAPADDVQVSNSGAITLPYPAAKVQLGYRFKSTLKLLRTEAGSAEGTATGQTRRIHRTAIQYYRCGELLVGMDETDLIPVEFDQVDTNRADTEVPLQSGIVRVGLEAPYDFENQLIVEQSSMLPGCIQSISLFLEEQDI